MREAAEVLFSARCMEHGLMVSNPLGSYPYDVVVDCGGLMRRIQIKTSERTVRGKFTFVIQRQGRTRDVPKKYTSEDCDFLVLHPLGTDIFAFLGPDLFQDRTRFTLNINKHSDIINNFSVLCTPE